MKRNRNVIIGEGGYGDGASWDTIHIDDLHSVGRLAAVDCSKEFEPLKVRFGKPLGIGRAEREAEHNYLLRIMETRFVKWWNNNRNAQAKQRLLKRQLPECSECGRQLGCFVCHSEPTRDVLAQLDLTNICSSSALSLTNKPPTMTIFVACCCR